MSHVTHENHCSFVIFDTFYKTCSQSDLLLWLHIVQDKMCHSPSTTTLPMTDATSTHSTLVKDELFSLIARKNQVVRLLFERPVRFHWYVHVHSNGSRFFLSFCGLVLCSTQIERMNMLRYEGQKCLQPLGVFNDLDQHIHI